MAGRLIVDLAKWALGLANLIAPTGSPKDSNGIRLPDELRPLHYDLVIKTDLLTQRFSGAEAIQIEVLKATSVIRLHSGRNLLLTYAAVCPTSTACRAIASGMDIDSQMQTLTIDTGSWHTFQPSETFNLLLRWESPINSDRGGYMLAPNTQFDDHQNEWSTACRFEPIDARMGFPSFDEPGYKAKLSLTMLSRNGTTNLANMALKEELPVFQSTRISFLEKLLLGSGELDGTWKTSRFVTSPPMSTCMVAWANGRFESIHSSYFSSIRNETVPMAVYGNHANISLESWALEVMESCMPLYEELFDLEYPLAKLDWMATSGLPQGAVETWGLVTGGASSTKWDPSKGLAMKNEVISLVAHELSHQWFANIVTMAWWDDIWLNEAFATWAGEVLMAPKLSADFQIWQPFLQLHVENSLVTDSYSTSHPIINEVISEDQLATIFSPLVYDKGASVIRMIASLLGQEAFLQGVSTYLKKHAYGNAQTEDLWQAVSSIVRGFDVEVFADSWTRRAGYPVVVVSRLAKDTFRLHQEEFKALVCSEGNVSSAIWPIPLFLDPESSSRLGNVGPPVMYGRAMVVHLHGIEQLVLNRGRLGFYRVQYDDAGTSWMTRQFQLRSPELSGSDRAAFLSDMAAFASTGRVATREALGLLTNMTGETDVNMWAGASSLLQQLRDLWWEQPVERRKLLDRFSTKVLQKTYGEVGYTGNPEESATPAKIRQYILPITARVGEPRAVNTSMALFGKLYDSMRGRSEETLPQLTMNEVDLIFETAVAHGGQSQWSSALKAWQRDRSHQYATAALMALGATRDPFLLNGTIQMVKDGSLVDSPSQTITLLTAMVANPQARRIAFDYSMEHIDEILAGLNDRTGLRTLAVLLSGLSSYSDHDFIRSKFSDPRYSDPNIQDEVRLALEKTRVAADWLARDVETTAQWMEEQLAFEW